MQLQGLRILLAEDNATNRLVVLQMLESVGATVEVAHDGVEALDRARREVFDVLLIDIEMPKMSGLEVIRCLAAEPDGRPRPPIVALTACAGARRRDEITGAGAAGVITKPIVSIEQFSRDIRRFVQAEPSADAGRSSVDIDVYRSLAAAVGAGALDEFLGKVDADMSAAYDRMQKAASEADMAELREATHILISVAGAVGAFELQSLAQRLNRVARDDDEAAVARLGPAVAAEAGRVRAFLDHERHG